MTTKEGCEDHIVSTYKRLGFMSASGEHLPLHRVCANRDACWSGALDRLSPPDIASISVPWIGPGYGELKLLVVGINFNEAGGEGATVDLVEGARAEMREGHWKHFRNPSYSGTPFYSVTGCYVVAIAEAAQFLKPSIGDNGLPSLEDIEKVFDFVAYTPQVKCNPMGAAGSPTTAMWSNCGRHVLRAEIEVLKPDTVLVVGVSKNKWYFGRNVLDSPAPPWSCGTNVHCANATVGGKPVKILAVPHPRRGGYRATFQEIRALCLAR